MSAFDLSRSAARAAARHGTRAARSDRGKSRLPEPIQVELSRLVSGQDRPPMQAILRRLGEVAARERVAVPARATVYAFLANAPAPSYRFAELPESVRATLHNLDPHAPVPGPQLVQRAFNAGDLSAISYASTLPWLCLYQAAALRGFRPKSLALLRAVMRTRGI